METNPDLGIINKKSIEILIKELQYLSDEVLSSLDNKKNDLSNLDVNLENYLSQNKTIVDDLSVLFEKLKADEKFKLKIKEVEINQTNVNDLIVKIENLQNTVDSAENIALSYKNTAETVSKNIVVDAKKIDEKLKELVQKIDDDLKNINDKDKKRDLKANEILKILNEKEKTSKTFYILSTFLLSISFFAIGFFTKYFLVLQDLEKNLTPFQFQTISNFIKPFF